MKAIHRKRLRALGVFVAVGVVIGALVGVLIHQIEGGALAPHFVRGVAIGILVGLLIGMGEELLFVGVGRGLSYFALNASRILLYTVGIIISLIGVNAVSIWLTRGTSLVEGVQLYTLGDTMGRDLTVWAERGRRLGPSHQVA